MSVNGNNNALHLASTATLILESNVGLLIKDIQLTGLTSDNFLMADNTSAITLEQAAIVLNDVLSFTLGSMYIKKEVIFEGQNNIFAYRSTQPLTISCANTLQFDYLTTFSYDPTVSMDDVLQFQDATSKLFFNGARLYAATGLQLTKGILLIDGLLFISNEAEIMYDAITFGNGSDSSENIDIQFLPESVLEVEAGIVLNSNVA